MPNAVVRLTTHVLPGNRVEVVDSQLHDGERVEVTVTPAAPDSTGETERRFTALADRWRRETAPLSSVSQIAMHPAYQEIIGMGSDVVPLILRDMQRNYAHWFWALRSITGQDPVPESKRGQVPAMTDAWLDWGRENGLIG
jgi:hypothetical protein